MAEQGWLEARRAHGRREGGTQPASLTKFPFLDILTEDDVYCSCLAKTLCHVPVPVTVGFYAPFGCRLHMMLDKIMSECLLQVTSPLSPPPPPNLLPRTLLKDTLVLPLPCSRTVPLRRKPGLFTKAAGHTLASDASLALWWGGGPQDPKHTDVDGRQQQKVGQLLATAVMAGVQSLLTVGFRPCLVNRCMREGHEWP